MPAARSPGFMPNRTRAASLQPDARTLPRLGAGRRRVANRYTASGTSTCRSDSGNRTYIVAASRTISGEPLKHRKGVRIPGRQGTSPGGSSRFALATPVGGPSGFASGGHEAGWLPVVVPEDERRGPSSVGASPEAVQGRIAVRLDAAAPAGRIAEIVVPSANGLACAAVVITAVEDAGLVWSGAAEDDF